MRAHLSSVFFMVFFALTAWGCGDDGGDESPPWARFGASDPGWTPAEALTLSFSTPPVDDLGSARFAEAVAYGAHERQVFDAFLPESEEPTPAVLYFHGGGFVEGSRTSAYGGSASALRRVLGEGVAYFAIDYRLLLPAGEETEGVRKSLLDARRALQFIRHHAEVFNVDPSRIGAYGGSAGAGTSLWLGFHDEAAEPRSKDLIARQSTRPSAVAAIETQATYDVVRWLPDVFAPAYPILTLDLALSLRPLRELLARFYGLPGELIDDRRGLQDALETPEKLEYRAELDMLAQLSTGDAPAYVQNEGPDAAPLAEGFDILHHPLHALALHEQSLEVGTELEARIPAFEIETSENAMGFLLDRL